MQKIFQEYGGVITTAMAIVALIGVIGLMFNPTGTGWMDGAFKGVINGFTDKVDNAIPGSAGNTYYSPEEIAENPYLYAIGTVGKETSLVAKFNNDYSEVTIAKNGDDSDGRMGSALFTSKEIAEHADTLVSVVVRPGVTEIQWDAFKGCSALKTVDLSKSDVTAIWSSAFDGCTSLTDVTLPNSLTNIYANAFANCTNLTSITIPESVTSIRWSFNGCTNLTNITFQGTIAQWEAMTANLGSIPANEVVCSDGPVSLS